MSDVRLTATNPEDSSVVPVACNAKGELKLEEPQVIEGPPGQQGEQGDPGQNGQDGKDGDPFSGNFAGDVTFGGSASFAADAIINTLTVGKGGGSVSNNTALGLNALLNNTTGSQNTAVGQNALNKNIEGGRNTAVGRNAGFYIEGSNNTILGAYQGTSADSSLSDTVIISAGPTKRLEIDSDGIATFSGDVVVSSRRKQWLLVEQGGLCHMVEQLRATTADLDDQIPVVAPEYPPLRDVFAELNVVEKALEEVMEKLRMTAPDGWPVWDGSDNSR